MECARRTHQRRGAGARAATRISAQPGGDGAASAGTRPGDAQCPRCRSLSAGGVEPGRSRGARVTERRRRVDRAELQAGGGGPMNDDVTRRAWAYLSRVAEPPCPQLAAWVAEVGPVEA